MAGTETESRLALHFLPLQQTPRKAGKDLVGAEGDGIVAAASQKMQHHEGKLYRVALEQTEVEKSCTVTVIMPLIV